MVLVTVAFFVLTNAMSGGGKETDCTAFRIAPGDWQAATFERRQDLVDGLSDCRTLHGKSLAEVEALLGPPLRRGSDGLVYEMPYETDSQFLRIESRGDVVQSLRVESPSTSIR